MSKTHNFTHINLLHVKVPNFREIESIPLLYSERIRLGWCQYFRMLFVT